MSYAADHAGAYADILAAGAAVTFTQLRTDAHDPTTGRMDPFTVTVTGAAMQVRGIPAQYEGTGLVESDAPTLLFAPATLGELPPLGSRVTWAGASYTTKQVTRIAPDGAAILARVIVAGGVPLTVTELVASDTSTVAASDTSEISA